MRHGNKINHLGKKTAHRAAMLSNLTIALITHKRINTTLAKAKVLRTFVEPIITKSKTDDTTNRRNVFAVLQDKEAIKELFGTISNKVGDRPGGYTRIIKLGTRQGDAAEMAMIELVDFNEVYNVGEVKAVKTRRSRAKATSTATAPVVSEETPATEVDTTSTEEASTPEVEEAVTPQVEEASAPAIEEEQTSEESSSEESSEAKPTED
jgi:large subunit ribosomal protein L17